jgi:flagellar hook assembly protein FlgD
MNRAGVTSTRYIRLNDQGQNFQLDAIETGPLTAVTENYGSTIPSLKLTTDPNPFRQKTEIRWQIAENNQADLKIYNAAGRVVKDFGVMSAEGNPKSISWDGRDNFGKRLPRGIYFVNLKTKNLEKVAKVTLIR